MANSVGYPEHDWNHISYGLRKDGTIGLEEPGLPVAESALLPRKRFVYEMQPIAYQWTDGTVGPIGGIDD